MESINKIKKRNPMISIAKAIGIILMVIGHVYDKQSWGVHYIYMFHMPLFFVLSGWFFKNPQSLTNIVSIARKKFLGLYLPYLYWSIAFVLFHNWLLQFGIGEHYYDVAALMQNVIKSAFSFVTTEKVLVGFWFLKALFTSCIFLSIVYYVMYKVHFSNTIFLGLLSLGLVFILFAFDVKNKTLLGMLYGTVFLLFGMNLRKLNFEKRKNKIMQIFLYAFIVLIVSMCFEVTEKIEMLSIDKTTFLPMVLAGCTGSAMVIVVSQCLSTNLYCKKFVNLFRYIGDHTMIILALHYPLIKIFDFYYIQNISGFTSFRLISGGAIGVVLPIAIYRMYDIIRIKNANR